MLMTRTFYLMRIFLKPIDKEIIDIGKLNRQFAVNFMFLDSLLDGLNLLVRCVQNRVYSITIFTSTWKNYNRKQTTLKLTK